MFSIDFYVHHNGEDGGPVDAACDQRQGCKGLPQARARLRVVPFGFFIDHKVMLNQLSNLAAVTISEEKERIIARISAQAAAQGQEGGPAKWSELLKVAWNVIAS